MEKKELEGLLNNAYQRNHADRKFLFIAITAILMLSLFVTTVTNIMYVNKQFDMLKANIDLLKTNIDKVEKNTKLTDKRMNELENRVLRIEIHIENELESKATDSTK